MTKTKPAKLQARVTHLEMGVRLSNHFPVPNKPVTAVMIAKNMSAGFYGYLYENVGKPHHWFDRRAMACDALEAIIHAPTCEIGILYADGCPAGFYELDLSQAPQSVAIQYFGLIPRYQGIGLGKWFLALSIQAAWAHTPDKILVETNSLDHPGALRMYQQMGFSPIAVSEAEIEPWI